VRCDPDAVSVSLQLVPQSQERLDIASTPDDLDDDIELDFEGRVWRLGIDICGWRML
jgi:hypothetical protein